MTAGDFRLVLKAWYMYALFFYFILLKPKYEIEHIKCVIFSQIAFSQSALKMKKKKKKDLLLTILPLKNYWARMRRLTVTSVAEVDDYRILMANFHHFHIGQVQTDTTDLSIEVRYTNSNNEVWHLIDKMK